MRHRSNHYNGVYSPFISQFVLHRQRIQEFTNFLNHRHRKRDRKYSECQLTFVLAPASNYSKQINIVPIVNISVRFVRQIIE